MKRYVFVKFNGRMIERSELPEYVKAVKEYRAKARRKETIRRHIRLKRLTWYVTITFDPKKKDRYQTHQRAIGKILRYHGIEYYLISEHHEDGAIHYHGFLSDKQGAYKYIGRDKRGYHYFECLPLQKNYGITRCYPLGVNNRTINYIVKYAVKQGNKALFSRIKLNEFERKTVDLFGDLVKFV